MLASIKPHFINHSATVIVRHRVFAAEISHYWFAYIFNTHFCVEFSYNFFYIVVKNFFILLFALIINSYFNFLLWVQFIILIFNVCLSNIIYNRAQNLFMKVSFTASFVQKYVLSNFDDKPPFLYKFLLHSMTLTLDDY